MSFFNPLRKPREEESRVETPQERIEPSVSGDAPQEAGSAADTAPWIRVNAETGEIAPEPVPERDLGPLRNKATEPAVRETNPADVNPWEPIAGSDGAAPGAPRSVPEVQTVDERTSASDAESVPAPKSEPERSEVVPEPAKTSRAVPAARERFAVAKRTKTLRVEVPSDEELAARRRTRHRLVGAAALLMAVVVAAPFVLDSEKSYRHLTMETDIPPVPTETTPLSVPDVVPTAVADKESEAAIEAQRAERKGTDTSETAKAAAAPSEKVASKPTAAEKPQAGKDSEAARKSASEKTPKAASDAASETKGSYYVQVLATSSEREADRTVKKLEKLGLPAYRVPLKKKAATIWRVRIGPYKDAKAAEGVKGTVVLNGIAAKPLVAQVK